MEEKIFTRKELYDCLWSEPSTALFKKYNLNYSGLKKICHDMNIPLPENGHWMKINFGKQVTIHALPSDYTGAPTVTLTIKKEGEQGIAKSITPLSILKEEIENGDFQKVPQKLSHPHKLIIAAKEKFLEKEAYVYNGLLNTSRDILNIKTSPSNVNRALRFMDALIKNFVARGHSINVEANGTFLTIQGVKFTIALREKLNRTPVNSENNWQKYLWTPANILILGIYQAYPILEFRDGRKLLENQLSEIIARLELKANELKIEREEIEAYWAEQRRQNEVKEEIERRKQKELSDFKLLLAESEQWSQAKTLRSYIDSIEAKMTENNIESEELKNWLEWAKDKTDVFDPLLKRIASFEKTLPQIIDLPQKRPKTA